MKNKRSDERKICEKCNVKMKVIATYRRLLELDEMGEMTDAVLSEYEAASMGGDSGDFEVNHIEYECPKCHDIATVEFL